MSRDETTPEATNASFSLRAFKDALSRLNEDEWLQLILRGGAFFNSLRSLRIAREESRRRFNVLAGEDRLRFGFKIHRVMKNCPRDSGCSANRDTQILDVGCSPGGQSISC